MTAHPPAGTLLLSQADVEAVLGPRDCRLAVQEAFRRHGAGEAAPPGILGFHADGGGFHIKAALYGSSQQPLFVAKTNANYPGNPSLRGTPTIQGIIQVFDATTGAVLAIMDSIAITTLRTAAASAVAADHLARKDASVLTIAGCGIQGRAHVHALRDVRAIERILLWDASADAAARLQAELRTAGDVACEVVSDLEGAVRASHIVATCTSATAPIVDAAWVTRGTFVAGVGADSEQKLELDPRLLATSRVVVDVLEQCATIGDLKAALAAGLMVREDVHAELGQVVAGVTPGRDSADQTFVFDSTGMALQDAATAVVVVQRAIDSGRGTRFTFGTSGAPRPR